VSPDDEIVESLEQMGIGSRVEVLAMLGQTGTNSAKMFFTILANGTDLSLLPWPEEHPFIDPVDYFTAPDGVTIDEQGDGISNLRIEMPNLMLALQRHLSASDFVWYHPSFRTLIGKARSRDIFVRLIAEVEPNGYVSLRVWMENGKEDEFTDFMNALKTILKEQKCIKPHGQLTESNTLPRFKMTEVASTLLVDDGHRWGCHPM
jgi:hypothetical protein